MMKFWVVYWESSRGEGPQYCNYFRNKDNALDFYRDHQNSDDDPWGELEIKQVETND
jgi:hypothetical protein